MTTKRFGQLPVLDELANGDIFAVTDLDTTTSKQVTGSKVTDFVLSDSNIEAKTSTIITKINELNPTVGNNLKATNFFVSNTLGYRPASYFLEYSNLTNSPTIPQDITDLNNAGNFISYDTSTGSGVMRVSGAGSTQQQMTSDYISEGSNNLFYTNARADERVELNFGSLFNIYSSTFDGGTVTESLQDVTGTFRSIVENQSNVVRVTDVSLADKFSVGQTLRIYRASASSEEISTTPTLNTPVVSGGFTSNASGVTFAYKAAKFNLSTGEIGPCTATKSVDVYNAGNDVVSAFNTTKFVQLSFGGYSASEGIVLYRQIAGVGDFKLIAVLGPKDLQVTPWKDYNTFDYTSWSGKSVTDNSFTKITHFPLTAHGASKLRGWSDATITSINTQSSFFDISFGTTYLFVNPDGVSQLAHNDTAKINEAILTKSAQGRKSITLNAKTYNASHISIPDNFGILGTPNITKVRKLPWTGYKSNSPDNSLLGTVSDSGAQSISLVGIDFEGNVSSQYLHIDDADRSVNYILNFNTGSKSVLIETCRIQSVVGGGIYASSPSEFKLTTSEITDSGVTDRFAFSPLIADGGQTTMISSNRMENFSDAIDCSVSNEVVVTPNIIKACGSGLYIYGSTFMLSSPNVLIGAANEFLHTPDILNSEYDIINIFRESFPTSGPYTSDKHSYQENGEAWDLTYSSTTTQPVIRYRANLIQKLANGSEQKYGNKVGPGAVGINGLPISSGASPFGMTAQQTYVILEAGNVNWSSIGAANNLPGTIFKYDGSTVTQTGGSVPTTGLAKSREFVGYGNVSVNTPVAFSNPTANVVPSEGGFQFVLSEAEVSRLDDGIYAPANLQTLYDAEVAAGRQPAGSSHVGVAWSASHVYYEKAGTVVGTLNTPWNITDSTNPSYTVRVDLGALRVPLVQRAGAAQGTIVRFQSHSGFTLFTGTGSMNYGEIVNIGDVGSPESSIKDITIKFHKGGDPSGTGSDPSDFGLAAGGSSGTINILDDFVMAQGLIK